MIMGLICYFIVLGCFVATNKVVVPPPSQSLHKEGFQVNPAVPLKIVNEMAMRCMVHHM